MWSVLGNSGSERDGCTMVALLCPAHCFSLKAFKTCFILVEKSPSTFSSRCSIPFRWANTKWWGWRENCSFLPCLPPKRGWSWNLNFGKHLNLVLVQSLCFSHIAQELSVFQLFTFAGFGFSSLLVLGHPTQGLKLEIGLFLNCPALLVELCEAQLCSQSDGWILAIAAAVPVAVTEIPPVLYLLNSE